MRASDLRDRDIRASALVELDEDITDREFEVLVPISQLDLSGIHLQLATNLSVQDFQRADPDSVAITTAPSRTPAAPADEAPAPTGRMDEAVPTLAPSANDALALAVSATREALVGRDGFTGIPIIVVAENGTLRLSGTVPTEHHKQLAAEVAQQASPGHTIENHLVVPQ